MTPPTAQASIDIDAPAEDVYRLLTDLSTMVELAAETCEYRWLDGADAVRVGARYAGTNRNGKRKWSTTATITDADQGSRFAFDVTVYGLPLARWQYDLTDREVGCTVTESTWTRVPSWFKPIGLLATGVRDRRVRNQANIAETLRSLKARAES